MENWMKTQPASNTWMKIKQHNTTYLGWKTALLSWREELTSQRRFDAGEVGCGYLWSSLAQLIAYRLMSERPVELQVHKGWAWYHQSKQINPNPLLTVKDHIAEPAVLKSEGGRELALCHLNVTREEMPAWISSLRHQQGSRIEEY